MIALVPQLMKLHIMESYCYPILPYALAWFNLKNTSVNQLNACWNSVYSKVFDFKSCESVREWSAVWIQWIL